MKVFWRLILIVFISGGILYAVNTLYEKGHRRFYAHETERLQELFSKKTDHDIVILGSSRAHQHYNTRVIDSVTNLSSYNFGIDGANLLESNLWLQVYLQQHKKPAVVVLDISLFSFEIDRNPFFNHTIYLPYLNNKIVFDIVKKYKPITHYRFVPFLKITEANDYHKYNAWRGLRGEKEDQSKLPSYKGYIELSRDTLKASAITVKDTTTYHVPKEGKLILKKIIDTCKKKNIALIFCYSPEFQGADQLKRKTVFDYITKVATVNNIPFFDYRNHPICSDSALFLNVRHLNVQGSEVFSSDFSKHINETLKK